MTDRGKRQVSPWKHTEKDRGWTRRKAAADERARVHVNGPECGPNCEALRAS